MFAEYLYGLTLLNALAIGVAVGAVIGLVWFYFREGVVRLLGIRTAAQEQLLLRACHADAELCERLIAAELHRSPTIARDEAARRARRALRRDRR